MGAITRTIRHVSCTYFRVYLGHTTHTQFDQISQLTNFFSLFPLVTSPGSATAAAAARTSRVALLKQHRPFVAGRCDRSFIHADDSPP